MWMKPSFFPEMGGKPRNLFSLSRYHTKQPEYMNPSPFALFLTPSHEFSARNESDDEPPELRYRAGGDLFGLSPFSPASLAFGWGYSKESGYGEGTIAEGGTITETLNHIGHSDNEPSPLEAHKWVHVAVQWTTEGDDSHPEVCSIYVNNKPYRWDMDGLMSRGAWYNRTDKEYTPGSTVDWTLHSAKKSSQGGTRNTFRIGAVSKYRGDDNTYSYDWNWPADATMDEIYFWNEVIPEEKLSKHWEAGRYYRVKDGSDGFYTSPAIELPGGAGFLPPPSKALPPGQESGGGPRSTVTSTSWNTPQSPRLLGVSWTWFGEVINVKRPPDPRDNGEEFLTDYVDESDLHPTVKVSIILGEVESEMFSDAGYSATVDSKTGQSLIVDGSFRYKVQFGWEDPKPNYDSILLTAPVFDDITIFYQTPGNVYVEYYVDY